MQRPVCGAFGEGAHHTMRKVWLAFPNAVRLYDDHDDGNPAHRVSWRHVTVLALVLGSLSRLHLAATGQFSHPWPPITE